jgi:hypothetical protein
MNRDVLSSLFCLVFGILFTVESFKFGLGAWFKPGPGYFPFWSGLLFSLLSLFVFIGAVRKRRPLPNDIDRFRWLNIALVLLSMFAYALLLQTLGFVLCTFGFAVFCLRAISRKGWVYSLVTGLTIAIVFQLLFNVLLNAQIPRGILGYLIG